MFFEKNKIDLDSSADVTFTITDSVATGTGISFIDYVRNRHNTDGWSTTGSSDAGNTQIDLDMGEKHFITDIFLVVQNWKAYTIQYYDDGATAYKDFSTAISETVNATETKRHSFTEVECQFIRIIITKTMTANDDKFLGQLIVTKYIGQFAEGFKISELEVGKNKTVTKTQSGKVWVKRDSGAFSCRLSKDNVSTDADLVLIETLHSYYYGFIVWLCGGDISQFRNERIGYRLKDLYLVTPTNEYEPNWDEGFYQHGINIKLDLTETI
jgi:hypothetical protein